MGQKNTARHGEIVAYSDSLAKSASLMLFYLVAQSHSQSQPTKAQVQSLRGYGEGDPEVPKTCVAHAVIAYTTEHQAIFLELRSYRQPFLESSRISRNSWP